MHFHIGLIMYICKEPNNSCHF
uniref:Uncharacterized protein n=1 Tax=Arundo donax TaxID=35708 RepID=A0A0A9BUW4_ARUDO